MKMKSVIELGVSEAHAILAARPGADRLPPLEAIENEDWGRDLLLSRFEEMTAEELTALGLTMEDPRPEAENDPLEGPGEPGRQSG